MEFGESELPDVQFRAFDDVDGQRQAIFDYAKRGVSEFGGIENATHRLEFTDVDYDDDGYAPSLSEEKKALLKRRSLHRALKGTVRLIDKNTGQVLDEQRTTLAHVPYLTQRGVFIRDGVPWQPRNQLRLRPGVYTRVKKSGETETHVNVKPGTGRGYRVEMDPATGIFKMRVDQSTTRLYPVLRALGVDDEEIKQAWGEQLYDANFRSESGKDDIDLIKLVKKLGRKTDDVDPTKLLETLRQIIERAEVDEDTAELTLGERLRNLSPKTLLRMTQKQLAVIRKEAAEDNRDSQAFQSIHSAEDFLRERLNRDTAGAVRNMLWRASRDGNLKKFHPGLLNKNINSLFIGSGLVATPEEINPTETLDLQQAVTRMGDHGISSLESVSREARNVQASYIGAIDANRAPESGSIGVDLRLTGTAMKGSDNQLYTLVRNTKTGEIERVSARTLASKTVAFPGELTSGKPRIAVVRNDKLTYARPETVDYEVMQPHDLMSVGTQLIPMPEGMKGQRLLMGARMTQQALSVMEPEAPLVQTGSPDGQSLHQKLGAKLGARFAPAAGVVVDVTEDYIDLQTPEGVKRVDLYNNYPLSRKSFLHNTPVVKPGDYVTEGQVLAPSNFTDKDGAFGIGRNLRVAYMAREGDTIEDAWVVSDSTAKKLAVQTMYKTDLDTADIKSTDKSDYVALFADKYKPEQYDKIDQNGVVKVGAVVQPNDPLVLAYADRKPGGIGAVMNTKLSGVVDRTQVWDHHNPGIVTDVDVGQNGIRVTVKSHKSLEPGDKVSGRFGNKGVVSKVIPDAQMPILADGQPAEIIANPFGVISRVNPNQLVESMLGKIAAKTGKPIAVPPFSGKNLVEWALEEGVKAGVITQNKDGTYNDVETVTDPRDGRKIPGIFTGVSYFMPLHHLAESKLSARDQATYTAMDLPARGGRHGSKRVSLSDAGVLISRGATEFLKDAKLVRGQKNDDYWRALRLGDTPQRPDKYVADEHFVGLLKAAGVNVKELGGGKEQLRPLLDRDVDAMAPYEITKSATLDFESLEPIQDGLFDIGKTGGAGGNRWSKIVLPQKVPHPMFTDAIVRLLGLTEKRFDAILAGQEQLNNKTGIAAIEDGLKDINLDREIETAKQAIRGTRKTARDEAARKLHYLAGLRDMGVKPEELLVSKLPVIPPRYRPIVQGQHVDMIHDLNYLYHDVMEAKQNYLDAMREFGEAPEEYATLVKAVRAVTGKEAPITPKHVEQGVKGVLSYAIGQGASPKTSTFQRTVIGTSVDTVGRTVITADGSLGMDEVGVPEDMAWDLFRPYVIRRLAREGLSPTESLKETKERTPRARKQLEEEMKVRPVVYNRAPALHRYAYTGGMAKLVAGDAFRVPYVTLKGLGADFDGDAENVHVPASEEAVKEVYDKFLPSKNLFFTGDFETHYEPVQDYTAGLYLATKPDRRQPLRTFTSLQEAKKAYARGEISARTPIRIIS